MTGPEVRATAVAVGAAVSATLPVFLLGPLAPQIRADLAFDRTQLGLAFGFCQAMSAALSWLVGRQVVRLGSQLATRIGMVASALSLLGIGALADSWVALVGMLALCGASSAICQPATNALLLDAVEPSRLGRAFGVKLAAIPLTALLAGLSVPLIAAPFGWRAAFLVAILLPVTAFVAAPRPVRSTLPSTIRTVSAVGTPLPVLVVLAVGCGFVIGSVNTVPAFFVESASEAGIDARTAAVILAGGAAFGVTARLCLGAWTDRRAAVRLGTVATMAAVGAFGFPLLRVDAIVPQALGVALVLGLGWGWVGLFQYLLSTVNPANPGGATGFTDTGGYVGAFLGPTIIGVVASRSSFDDAWWVPFGIALAGSGLFAIANRSRAMSRPTLDPTA